MTPPENTDPIRVHLSYIKDRLDRVEGKIDGNLEAVTTMLAAMDEKYVRKETFNEKLKPIVAAVYGLVGLVMLTVFGAMLAGVVKSVGS